MGFYTHLLVDDHVIYDVKNGYPPGLDVLFRQVELSPQEADEDPDDDTRWDRLTTPLRLAQFRLNISGYTLSRARNAYDSWRSFLLQPPHEPDFYDPKQLSAEYYASHTFDEYVSNLTTLVLSTDLYPPDHEYLWDGQSGYLWQFPDEDPVVALSVVLHSLPGDHISASLQVSDDGSTPRLDSRPQLIVLTEGRSDAQILQRAFSLLAPGFVREIKFLDHDYRPPAGSSEIVNLLKSFAAAGVRSPVLALFDNDTAGHLALQQAKQIALPGNFVVDTYPYLESAKCYPTLGPSGKEAHDINGSACSLELYLGADALTVNGRLSPVRWIGFQDRMNRYQGVVSDKPQVQSAFEQKLAQSEQSGRLVGDWNGIEAILNGIINAAAQLRH